MTEHNLFYYSYATFTNAQFPLLKVAAPHFEKPVVVDPVGSSGATIGAKQRRTLKITRMWRSGQLLG